MHLTNHARPGFCIRSRAFLRPASTSLHSLINSMQPASNPPVAQLEPVQMPLAGHRTPPGGYTPPVGLGICPEWEYGGWSIYLCQVMCLVCLYHFWCVPNHICIMLCVYQVCIMFGTCAVMFILCCVCVSCQCHIVSMLWVCTVLYVYCIYSMLCVCVYHVANPYCVSYAYATLYACIMLCVSTVLCVHLWLRPPTGPEIGISAHIFYLLAPQTCCIPAFCQHLCMGTRAATLLVMGWEKLQTTTLSTTELSNSKCPDQHWRILEPFSGSKKETGHWGCRGWPLLSIPSPIYIWERPTRSHSCTWVSPSGQFEGLEPFSTETKSCTRVSTGTRAELWDACMGSSAKGVSIEVTIGCDCVDC